MIMTTTFTLRNLVVVTAMGLTASFAVHAAGPRESEMLAKAIIVIMMAPNLANITD